MIKHRLCLGHMKYNPKLLVSSFQVKAIQSNEVKKVKLKSLALGGVMHLFMPVFRQEPENDQKIF